MFATVVERRLETAEGPWSLALGFDPKGYVMVRRSLDVGGKFTCTTVGESVKGIAADCGGMLTCATCHVLMDEPWMQAGSALPPPTSEESEMLQFTATERQPQSRLSCQTVLTPALDGLTVRLPVSQY